MCTHSLKQAVCALGLAVLLSAPSQGFAAGSGKVLSVHDLKTIEAVRSGDVFIVHARAAASIEGQWIRDVDCSLQCDDVLSLNIYSRLESHDDIKQFEALIGKTLTGEFCVDIQAHVSLNFGRAYGITDKPYYRVSGINLLSVEKMKLVPCLTAP